METYNEEDRRILNSYLWWIVLNSEAKSLKEIREYLPIMLGMEISENDIQKISIFWWERIKVNEGKIKIWDSVITSCELPVDWNLGEYNITVDYNWVCLYDWKRLYNGDGPCILKRDGFLVITETDVEWKKTYKIIEVKVRK